jgi:tetratricopeptide (TPR) repeat protein
LRLADMLLALGDFDAAEQQYRQAAEAHADPSLVALGLAKLAVARNQPARALEYLASIADDPLVRKRAGVLRATLLERSAEKEAAEQERQRLAQLPEDRMAAGDPIEKVIEREIGVRAMISKAQRLWNEKQPRPMVAVMRKAVKRYPDSDAAWSSLSAALSATGDAAGSEQALRRCVELAPKTVKYRLSLGKLLTGQKRYDEALQELRTAIELSPQDGLTHLALGECLLEQGDKEQAVEAFQATLRYLPDDAAAKRYLEQLAASDGSK